MFYTGLALGFIKPELGPYGFQQIRQNIPTLLIVSLGSDDIMVSWMTVLPLRTYNRFFNRLVDGYSSIHPSLKANRIQAKKANLHFCPVPKFSHNVWLSLQKGPDYRRHLWYWPSNGRTSPAK